MKYNRDLKFDLEVGVMAEVKLGKILQGRRIEVKTDFKAKKTENVFVEYVSRGKKSGLATSQAEYWCFIISNEQYILIKTTELKTKCRKYFGTNRDVLGGDSNTSKGILLPLIDLIK